jgi:TRAP-type C4-dicarboxylate transport system substrate-binding protein
VIRNRLTSLAGRPIAVWSRAYGVPSNKQEHQRRLHFGAGLSASEAGMRPDVTSAHVAKILEEKSREEQMCVMQRAIGVGMAVAVSTVAVWSLALGSARAAEEKTYVITLPTLNDAVHQFAKNYAAAVEKDSGGRIKAEVYPASQLGSIARQIEGVQFGAIQCAVIPPEFFVGVDERFEMMTAPGLTDSLEHGQRIAADPAVLKLMLGLGAHKGLHGVGLFEATPSAIVSRKPIRHLEDFNGKKLRIFASDFQFESLKRLGATGVAMTLGDVLPAIQQGAIDGAIAALAVYVPMHFQDAAKYVTETNQPAIFLIVEISRKWYDTLPKDLQQVIDKDAARESVAINPVSLEMQGKFRKLWVERGGELISLPLNEQQSMMKTLSSVGADVSNKKPQLAAAYKIVTQAAAGARLAMH